MKPGPVTVRLVLLTRWIHAVPHYLPGRAIPTPAQLATAARRQARADRLSGYRVVGPERAPTVAPWSNATR